MPAWKSMVAPNMWVKPFWIFLPSPESSECNQKIDPSQHCMEQKNCPAKPYSKSWSKESWAEAIVVVLNHLILGALFFLYKWTCLSIPAILSYHLWAVCRRYIFCTNIMVDSEWNSCVCQSVTHHHLEQKSESFCSALTTTLHLYYWLSNQI